MKKNILDKYEIQQGSQPIFKSGNNIGCLLIHGFTSSPDQMSFLANSLYKLGYTVYAPRITHHGSHDLDLNRTKSWDWYLSVLDAWYVLSQQCQYIIPIGFSMGGALALTLAAKRPVLAVVSISAPYSTIKPWWWHFRHIMQYIIQYVPVTDEPWNDQNAKRTRILYEKNNFQGLLAGMEGLNEFSSLLNKIIAPTLLLHGNNDKIVPTECMHSIFDLLRTKNKHKIEIETINHHLVQDSIKNDVFNCISSFIQKQVKAIQQENKYIINR